MLFRERQLMNLFKLGDWIKSTKYPNLNPIQIESIYESNTRPGTLGLKSKGTVLYSDEVKLWQPKVGEWCWFWNNNQPKLKKLYSINYEHNVHWTYKTIDCKTYQHCEPFIGQLPSILKDNS